MKTEDALILGLAAVACWMIVRTVRPASAVATPATGSSGATLIPNQSLPGNAAWGWSYYSDGTAISPDGTYYMGGTKLWSPG